MSVPGKRRAAPLQALRSRPVRRALPFLLLVALVAPATAAADDRQVWNAYTDSAASARFEKSLNRVARAFERAGDRPTERRIRRALRASRRLAKTTGALRKRIAREQASSEDGKRGRKLLLKGLDNVRTGAQRAVRGTRALLHGHRRRARRILNRSADAFDRGGRQLERGEKAFDEAGVARAVKRAAAGV